jgi:sugar phosphate isomerase/epimerase
MENFAMRLAICNETFGEMPLEQAVEMAASLGYTGWEVAPFMLGRDAMSISPAQRREYRRIVKSAGLEIIGLHWLLAKTEGYHLTTDDAQTRRRTAAYFEELIRLCADLCEESTQGVMVLGSPQQRNLAEHISTEQAYEHAAEVLGGLGDSLQRHNVRIALEPLGPQEGNFLNTAAEARQLHAKIGLAQIGLHLDVKAMSTEPEDIPTVIRKNADWLLHFHANDPNRRGPGMGDVDFGPIIAALREVGYDRWISVEVFDYEPGAERLARESIETLQRVLAGG